jgi:penicillin G amidase
MKKPKVKEMACPHRCGMVTAVVISILLLAVAGCFNNGGGGDDLTVAILSPATDVTIYVGDAVDFQSSVTDGTAPYSYAWDFGGGATNVTVADPGSVTFASAGAYTVTLTVTDDLGSSDSDSVTVTVLIPLATTRDDKGVWFISGDANESLYNVFEAMGYAVATDRLWQAEQYRRNARGTLSEIFGASQLETDVFVRTTGYTEAELTAGFSALSTDVQAVINGYVAGFNRRIQEIRDDPTQLPFEFIAIGNQLGTTFIPADWTYQDVLAWVAMLQRNFDPEALDFDQVENAELYQELVANYGLEDGTDMFNDLRWTNDPKAQTYIVNGLAGTSAGAPPDKQLPVQDTVSAISAASAVNFSAAAQAMKERRNNYIDNLKSIGAYVKMGSYAWVVSGDHTTTGNPVIYSGPQMGFSVPSIVMEGSINAGGMQISGMTVAGIPGIIIGRTPHHAWSMQVGHAHSLDFYMEDPADVTLARTETIHVAGQDDVIIPVYTTAHGPVVNPLPYDPTTYKAGSDGPIFSWKYAHKDYEFQASEGFIALAQATSMDEFGAGIEKFGVSQHFCYADRDANIAYWMSGRNPVRPAGEWRMPQGAAGAALEWDAAILSERSTDRNAARGYYGGWNNKTQPDYDNCYNSNNDIYGPFQRAHVIYEYLHDNTGGPTQLSFAELRDLALNIATTDSFNGGGNPWALVSEHFITAVTAAGANTEREDALALLAAWDGHFVEGGEASWAEGEDRPDAWVLMDEWIDEVLDLTFGDEDMEDQRDTLLFNVLIHALEDDPTGIQNSYDWFQNLDDAGAPQTSDAIIVQALDTVLTELGAQPWGTDEREEITYTHQILGMQVHSTPYSNRSTYAHCVEYGSTGPVRIESMFPLGESGDIRAGGGGAPVFDDNFFSMAKDESEDPILFDLFEMRSFPLFD